MIAEAPQGRDPRRPPLLATLASLGVLMGVALLAISIGPIEIAPAEIFAALGQGPNPAAPDQAHVVMWSVRLPRVALGVVVGAGLGASGAALQGLFRNPLADPYVLGIASGGGLGAALVLLLAGGALGATGVAAEWVPAGAFIGAAAAAAAVYVMAYDGGGLSLAAVLLAGVAVGLTCSAGVSLVLVLAETRAGDIIQWLLGDLGGHGWAEVGVVTLCVIPAVATLVAYGRALDCLLLGEEAAASLGVDVPRARLAILAAVSLAVAGAVAYCGLIGFIGLIVPHIMRMLIGARHGWLIPASAIAGAALLVGADGLARTLLVDRTLPVGVVTGCVGGPFFLWLLRRRLT